MHRDKAHRATMTFPTYSQIETPLVKKERYTVCIDGFIALRARRAVADAKQAREAEENV